jgi:2-methylisocitrate lyase-like PEP mutase family enzyme
MAASMNPLRALHRPGKPLILPNVWDAASARVVAKANFGAVATSSAAVAESLGYADGSTPVAEMLDAIARIAAAVEVPVTADFERGHGLKAAELVERLAAAGVVGCNIEDSEPVTGRLVDPQKHADFLAAIRTADPDLDLNARIDSASYDDALARARLYLAAGADCIYPIFLPVDQLGAFIEAADAPVNAHYQPTGPTLSELARQGVARISYGPYLFRTMQSYLATLLTPVP